MENVPRISGRLRDLPGQRDRIQVNEMESILSIGLNLKSI